jgi:RNA polymerase primary sigma factor
METMEKKGKTIRARHVLTKSGLKFREQNAALCRTVQASSGEDRKQAMEKLLLQNECFIRKFVMIWSKKPYGALDADDLYQECCIGMMIAAERFDPDQNASFSSYAVYWMRQRVNRYLQSTGTVVYIPVYYYTELNQIKRKLREQGLAAEKKDLIDYIENRDEIPALKKNGLEVLISANAPVSLEAAIEYRERPEISDRKNILAGSFLQTSDCVEEEVVSRLFAADIDLLMRSVLTLRENEILRMYYGFDNKEQMTYEQIGEFYHLSRERIRQIATAACQKLYRRLKRTM